MDYLLLHLCSVELATILWDGFHTTRYIVLSMDLSRLIKVHQVGLIMLLVGQMISIILITVDRVLSVKLTIKYKVMVTKSRLLIILVVCWAVCISQGFIVHYASHEVLNKKLSAWEILVAIIIVVGYGYIFIKTRYGDRRLAYITQQQRRTTVKPTVPGLIVVTFVFLCLIPDLLLAIGVKFSLWILSVFYLNFMTDSLIYIFGSGQIRTRIRKFLHRRCQIRKGRQVTANLLFSYSCYFIGCSSHRMLPILRKQRNKKVMDYPLI